MSKHTPGPWKWLHNLDGHSMTINKDSKTPIAGISGMGLHVGQDVAESNARLIAAAPDLLEAQRDLVNLAEAAMKQANNNGAEYDIDGELAAARAAIAKAEGQQ